MKKNLKKYGAAAGAGALLTAGSASAAAIDVTSVTAVVTDVATAAGVIGLAVLGMHYGIKAYKWIKGAG